MILFYSVSFLAAFLLFQIELIVAKMLLPTFGGSYMVWGGCMVFFQCLLFLGYAAASYIIKNFPAKKYRYVLLILLLLPLCSFPGRNLTFFPALSNLPLMADIFWQLFLNIGLVFFALSTISVLLQSWLSDSKLPQKTNPYALYSISNLGSFAGLLSYPFIFEVYFSIPEQLTIWKIAYTFLLATYALMLFKIPLTETREITQSTEHKKTTLQEYTVWFLFSCAANILFLATTNIITYEITPIPLLWIIPLSIYLVSFVLNFKKNPWYPAWLEKLFLPAITFGSLWFFLSTRKYLPFLIEGMLYLLTLFVLCMFCQRQLFKSRPESARLGNFYLALAGGGLCGSIFVSWISPLLFTTTIEYFIGLLVLSLPFLFHGKRLPIGAVNLRLIIYLIVTVVFWPVFFERYNFPALCAIAIIFFLAYRQLIQNKAALFLSLLSLLCIAMFAQQIWTSRLIFSYRNYYGIYTITHDKNGVLWLKNGTTLHGAQFINPALQGKPLSYFSILSPVGEILKHPDFLAGHVGIVGLGTGTLATYAKSGQTFDFFELDPQVFTIADTLFSYLKNSQGTINMFFGDARVSMKKIPDHSYKILIIDAFGGDSVPVHLLTTQALLEYKRILTNDGIILFHISNRYFTLDPVLAQNAQAVQAHTLLKVHMMQHPIILSSIWVALTWDSAIQEKLTSLLFWETLLPTGQVRNTTDTYSTLLSVIKLDSIFKKLKDFKLFYW